MGYDQHYENGSLFALHGMGGHLTLYPDRIHLLRHGP